MKTFYWAILTALVWGFVPIIEKIGLNKIDPLVGLFYRSLGILLGIGILVVFKTSAIKASIASCPQGWLYLMTGGFLASFVGQILFYHALKSGEASKVVAIAASYPLLSFVLGVLILGEKITVAKACGVLSILVGVFFLK
jgi:bacterial/archaeal transporter family protein